MAKIRPIGEEDMLAVASIWNGVVQEGKSFPWDVALSMDGLGKLFEAQTATRVAVEGTEVVGVYILHPNNLGRCGHIANASYAVHREMRGRGIGRQLVEDSIEQAKQHGFKGLQFNAVVVGNLPAVTLYLKLGFKILATVPGGFRMPDGSYEDTLIFLKEL